ncbi:MAG: DUF2085 domain-containing protein [Chloroflexota bacterium]|nr:DUF2085 domain-containing protein [Chloroflexota bacterium]
MEASRRHTGVLPLEWLLAALLLGVAALALVPNTQAVIAALRLFHSGVDYHEDASHSFFLAGAQSVMCARNTGIYTGALLLFLWAWASGRGRAQGFPPLRLGLALALLFGVMVADGVNSLVAEIGYPTPYEPTIPLRLGTGLLAGVAVGPYFLPVLNGLLWRDADARPALPSYRALLGVVLLAALLWLAVVLGIDALALPVALLTTGATLALFGGVNLLFLLLALRRDNRVERVRDLLWPGAVALSLALVQLSLLSWLVRDIIMDV